MSRSNPRQASPYYWIVVLACVAVAVGWIWYVVPERPNVATRSIEQAGDASPQDRPLLRQFNTDRLTLPVDQIHRGGPPKDGIPSLTDPDTKPVNDARFDAGSRVAVVTLNEQTRGYPFPILNWHEAVNDTLGDVPLAVIYCPLCDSVSVVDRRLKTDDGKTKVLEFGISGLLYNSNVLLYDRQDEALWSQVGLEAVSGPHAGRSLDHLPFRIMTSARFRDQHPDATVLTTDTGHHRNYRRNPYTQYFATDRLMFPVKREDDRLPKKEPVLGIRVGDRAKAYPVAAIRQANDGVVEDQLGEHRIVLRADEHGTVAIDRAPEEAQVVHTFWFTWAAFHPQTAVFGEN